MKEIFESAKECIEKANYVGCFDIVDEIIKISPSHLKTRYSEFKAKFSQGNISVYYSQELTVFIKDVVDNIISSQELKNTTLNLCVLSTTQKNIVCSEELKSQISVNSHHKTDCSLWKPFEKEVSIKEMIEEYKTKVDFEVVEQFLGKENIQKQDKANSLRNTDKIILIVDPFALHKNNLEIATIFDHNEVGACFVLLCQSVSFELFEYIRTQVKATFENLHVEFIKYGKEFFHFIFPISTKELFFRALSNVALLRLNISSEIENLDTDDKIRKNNFKF